MQNFFTNLKLRIVKWCLSERTLTAAQILDDSNLVDQEILDPFGKVKFTAAGTTDLLVQTPIGWSPIKRTLKTVAFEVYELRTETRALKCADEHIVIAADGSEKFVKDLKSGDAVRTVSGIETVLSVKNLGYSEKMCDLELADNDHVFYTNGILSHNTLTVAMYLLWFACFNDDVTVLIASKNQSHALEIASRVRFAYEELPNWIKPGLKYYNRHNIEMDNGSRIVSEATTEKTGRGLSITKLYLDELAFISPRIQEALWASLAPTLSTGGSAIISSTPNGDTELFAQLWRTAMSGVEDKAGTNFVPFQVHWREHPDRGDDYWQTMINMLGELKTRQEVGCHFAKTPINTSSGTLTMEELYAAIGEQEVCIVPAGQQGILPD